jgi:hypothetical protein
MNFKLLVGFCLLGTVALFSGTPAQANSYDLTFTAEGNTISGGIVFDKSATDFSVNSLVSTDLQINGDPFVLSDMTFQNNFGSDVIIYGVLAGIGVAGGTHDFWIRYHQGTGAFFDFTNGDAIITESGTTTFTSLAAAPVPGPIVGAGLPGLVMAFGGLLAWRRRKAVDA